MFRKKDAGISAQMNESLVPLNKIVFSRRLYYTVCHPYVPKIWMANGIKGPSQSPLARYGGFSLALDGRMAENAKQEGGSLRRRHSALNKRDLHRRFLILICGA
jgi:hypothetical protein